MSTCRALAAALQSVLLVGHVKALRPVKWFPKREKEETERNMGNNFLLLFIVVK